MGRAEPGMEGVKLVGTLKTRGGFMGRAEPGMEGVQCQTIAKALPIIA